MARIVLVHGIGQEQGGPAVSENVWRPALADGVRAAGHNDLADAIWPGSAFQRVETRMAHYGKLFIHPDQQGSPGDLSDLTAAEAAMSEQLALEWLRTAALYADDPRDRADAELAVRAMEAGDSPSEDQQGRSMLRAPMNALAGIRWFAPAGVALGGTIAWRALRQVPRYFNDPHVRTTAQQSVLDLLSPDTRLVIAHSLGTVVAYEALHRADQPVSLITLGSPLGLRHVIYDRLQPSPAYVPGCVVRWDNFVDLDDLVAAHIDLDPFFPPAPGRDIRPRTSQPLDNGSAPHDATHYLTKRSVGRAVVAALTQMEGPG